MWAQVCPWWMGYFLANPLRRLFQDPRQILGTYIKKGMIVLDVGSGMGFFSLPIADLVGEKGQVIAVDLQEKMLRSLRKRARKAGVLGRIETRQCSDHSLGIENLSGRIDFALAFAVLHEIPDIPAALTSICLSLKKGGLLLIAEPHGHVSREDFRKTISIANGCGLETAESPHIWRSHSVLLTKCAQN
jgi:ubiquinone/menaquinone biosynthesis C-methylase UbiE